MADMPVQAGSHAAAAVVPLAPEALDFAPDLLAIQERPPSRMPRALSVTIVALVGLLLLWAIFFKLDIIASAEGRLVPLTFTKVVQPAEAGVVTEILVDDGQAVKEGQLLMRLDARMSQADTAALGKDVALRRLTLRRIDADPSNPRRQDYLARFADREGREFLARFYRKYAGKPAHEAKTCWCTARGRRRRAWPPRSTVSNPTRTRTASQSSSRGACPTPISPTRRCRHCATRSVRTAGRWPTAATWRRAPAGTVGCGLPAPTSQGHARRGGRGQRPERQVLTPSYASALGASGDWPAALAELMGIIVNRGMRLPVTRVASLQFARGTKRASCTSRRRPSACSSPRSRRALIGVVEEGTAKRLKGALIRRVWQRGGDRWQDGHGRPPLRHLRARRPIALFARGEPFGDPGLCCPWSTASPAASHSTIGSRPGRCAARRAETFTLLASAARNCSTWAKVMMDPGIAALPRQRPAAVGRGAGSVCSLCSSSAA